ncbi:MAG TPA: fumarylacetoacetate hydrolase family protein [Pseudorhizobium sp.]|jgi:2-keto-4-pentenoate hydratase/2-oxohepta-3-ene-1,7-dioic acid hydratase in catechol pathway|nr:fumarylacetoacetate hydrolase family protein [Pseudorhizobium sp.]
MSNRGTSCLDVFRAWDRIEGVITDATHRINGRVGISSSEVEVLTPIRYPATLLAVGANYSGHLKEMGLDAGRWASMPFFIRPPKSTLVGPGATVIIPRSTRQFDWECELAVVIGRPLRHATKVEAAAAIAGYSIGLDLSCRDLIQVDNDLKVDLLRGKAQDTMAPMPATRYRRSSAIPTVGWCRPQHSGKPDC